MHFAINSTKFGTVLVYGKVTILKIGGVPNVVLLSKSARFYPLSAGLIVMHISILQNHMKTSLQITCTPVYRKHFLSACVSI